MSDNGTMHAGEVPTNTTLVRGLLRAQFPQWADLPLAPVSSAGTDNALYRLGDDKAVRMPRIEWAAPQVDKEQRWLPRLAPLPLAIPVPLAKGTPGDDYPFHWSVYGWLDGENAALECLTDPRKAATDLAHFITALHRLDAANGPLSGAHNFGRGEPLARRDLDTRAAIAALRYAYDPNALTLAWEDALHAPPWNEPPVWIHGDLQSGNLLAVRGRLSAVIDWGGLGVGDPACDLLPAWNLFSPDTRDVFRAALSVDDACWKRGRGWALSVALIALPYYGDTNPALADASRRTIEEVCADVERAA